MHKIYKCVRGAKIIYDEVASKILQMLRKGSHLIMRNKVKKYDMEMRQRKIYSK